ncbi:MULTISPECIES: MFS transporter [Paraburkholderia]|uniref:MFS transporter n=1 Tax=Paraburkholderia TaxID=1822464 RepID=UPI0038BA0C57
MSANSSEHTLQAGYAAPGDEYSADAQRRLGLRVVMSSYVGSTVEWFDFFIYSIASASVFNVLFFPQLGSTGGTLVAFATIAIGYLVRPLGGVIYGHFGDRIGRKKMLISSIVLMGISTMLVGIMPTYAQIGLWAPLLLMALRMLQGLAVAGEWGGGLLMTLEHAGPGKRGLWSCVIGMGQCSGLLLGTAAFGLVSRLPEAQLLSWGWRLPFLGAVLLIVIGLWMRLGISESPVFLEQKRKDQAQRKAPRLPLAQVLQTQWRQVLQAALMVSGPFVISALISPFSIAYSVQAGFPRVIALNAATAAALCQVIGMFCGGWLSDKVGRRPVFMAAAVLMATNISALLHLATLHDNGMLVLGFALAGLAHGFMFGPLGAFITELFTTSTRFTGASLGYQLAGALGGGFTPLIAGALLAAGGGVPHAQYVIAFGALFCVVSFIVALKSRETYREDLNAVGAASGAGSGA